MENKVETNILKSSSKKLIIFEIICVVAIIGGIGYTYSFFNVTSSNSTVISGEAASVNLTLTVTKVSPSDTKGLIPQLDQYITSAVIGRKGSCVDDNNNNVCQVYKITLKNIGTASVYVNGTVTLNINNNPNLKWAQISGPTSPTLTSNVNKNTYTILTQNEFYNVSEEKNYYIVLWISETGGIQTDNGKFSGIVRFENVSDTQSAAKDTLTRLGLIESLGTPDFSKTSCLSGCDEATIGIYKAQDNLGVSYYFRGDVENNYVYFAGFYWRIIRINGDGSIRMIYDGTSAHDNGESSTDRQIGTSQFNSSYDDNAYVGFMYGTAGASAYEETHANTNDSAIKTYLDSWYSANIKNTDYEQYVVDAIYCNDRKIQNGEGIGTETTLYLPFARLMYLNEPTFYCTLYNDKFTTSTSNGNGKLQYPIGLITADELVYAGNRQKSALTYVSIGYSFWTMTPAAYNFNNSSSTLNFIFNSESYGDGGIVGSYFAVRPVISISSTSLNSGNGTKNAPFKIS